MVKDDYLKMKFGNQIMAALHDQDIEEIMRNPDGAVWFKTYNGSKYIFHMPESIARSIIYAVADMEESYINESRPYLDAVLPFNGERFNATIPPVTQQVSFNIRKHNHQVLTIADYVKSNALTMEQVDYLINAVRAKKNILVSGSPGAGKTTFVNALLDIVSHDLDDGHRVLLIEQNPELKCSSKNTKRLLTSETTDVNKLLWLTMRNSPDRIIVGEVRDGSAYALLKAWNTGCPGGIATIHANNPAAAVQRILDLSCEATSKPPYELASQVLEVIVQIGIDERKQRKIEYLSEIVGFNAETRKFYFKHINGRALCETACGEQVESHLPFTSSSNPVQPTLQMSA